MIDTQTAVRIVLRRIPPAYRQIETAAESKRIVYHDNLLMMRTAQRHMTIETEIDIGRRIPAKRDGRQEFALHRVDDGVVPQEKLDLEFRLFTSERRKEIAETHVPALVSGAE